MTIWERFVELIRSIFSDGGKPDVSAYGYVYSRVVAALERDGVKVGRGAAIPRIEVHTLTEAERLDKGNCLRQMSVTVETIHNRSLNDCVVIADENLAILTAKGPETFTGDVVSGRILGYVPTLRQDMTESSDTQKIVYRILDTYTVWVELTAVEPPPAPDPEPTPDDPTPEPANP